MTCNFDVTCPAFEVFEAKEMSMESLSFPGTWLKQTTVRAVKHGSKLPDKSRNCWKELFLLLLRQMTQHEPQELDCVADPLKIVAYSLWPVGASTIPIKMDSQMMIVNSLNIKIKRNHRTIINIMINWHVSSKVQRIAYIELKVLSIHFPLLESQKKIIFIFCYIKKNFQNSKMVILTCCSWKHPTAQQQNSCRAILSCFFKDQIK